MKQFFKRLRLVFTYGPDIDAILKIEKDIREANERDRKRQQLDLCEKHQQASPGSHYAEHNCDYCKLKAQVHDLIIENTPDQKIKKPLARLLVLATKHCPVTHKDWKELLQLTQKIEEITLH